MLWPKSCFIRRRGRPRDPVRLSITIWIARIISPLMVHGARRLHVPRPDRCGEVCRQTGSRHSLYLSNFWLLCPVIPCYFRFDGDPPPAGGTHLCIWFAS